MKTQLRWKLRTPPPSPIRRRGARSPGLKGPEETCQSRFQGKNHFPESCRAKDTCVSQNMHIVQSGIILKCSEVNQRYRGTLLNFCWLLTALLFDLNKTKNHPSLSNNAVQPFRLYFKYTLSKYSRSFHVWASPYSQRRLTSPFSPQLQPVAVSDLGRWLLEAAPAAVPLQRTRCHSCTISRVSASLCIFQMWVNDLTISGYPGLKE